MTDLLDMELVPVESLKLDPKNARDHPARNIDAIKRSLERFGQQRAIVVDADGIVIAGNGTLQAARALGWKDIHIHRTHLAGVEARAFSLADNRTAELARWHDENLALALLEIQQDPTFDVTFTGFSEEEVRRIAKANGHLLPDAAPPPPPNPVSRAGDLWILGQHKILCGDSTKAEDLDRLMAGEKAVLMATDPPFLVEYDGGNHPQSFSNSPTTKDARWLDYVEHAADSGLYEKFLRAAIPHCAESAVFYQWFATRRSPEIYRAWELNDLLPHQQLVWVKARPVLNRTHFMQQHEPCLYGWRNGHQPEVTRRPPNNQSTVWQLDQVGQQDGIHPTQKPVEIFERPILWHTRPGEFVLEPFSGSGTQIIAAEKLKRRCRALEISPAFVDVAVRRWQKFTGEEARIEGAGTFSETAAERGVEVPGDE